MNRHFFLFLLIYIYIYLYIYNYIYIFAQWSRPQETIAISRKSPSRVNLKHNDLMIPLVFLPNFLHIMSCPLSSISPMFPYVSHFSHVLQVGSHIFTSVQGRFRSHLAAAATEAENCWEAALHAAGRNSSSLEPLGSIAGLSGDHVDIVGRGTQNWVVSKL